MLLICRKSTAGPPVISDCHNYSSEQQRQIFPLSNQNNCLGNIEARDAREGYDDMKRNKST